MSAKAEYAVRAMAQLATVGPGVLTKTDELAKAQGIPPQFLVDILSDLRADRLVRSHRGRDGGYELARPADQISIADELRCIDGPLASVRDLGLGDLDIESASKDGAQRFDDIKNPSAVQNEIYQQMERNSNKQADRISGGINRANAGGESIPDQIAKLSALRDQGVLTEAEFQTKKADLLGRM